MKRNIMKLALLMILSMMCRLHWPLRQRLIHLTPPTLRGNMLVRQRHGNLGVLRVHR